MMKILSGAVVAGIILVVAGAVSLMVPSTSAAKQRPQPTFDNNAWIAYWDYDKGLKEAREISSQLNSVSYFGGALDGRGLRCGVPPRQTQTDNDASGSPQRVKKRPDRGLRRGRPGKAARLKCDVHDMYDG
ncbi:hypothetical protein [Megasphaera elsdenii]|jgi:hypothetical protein|uniref:hypothetical protein n=1 Tax=Megasphaera elsdenii TaxID=907 RepID=UPI00266F1A8F|nr:hypothetical protein [Megasphaera elsdenii]